jgi:hypothetical protein
MEPFKRLLRNRRVLIAAILAVLAIPTAWLLAKDTVVVEDSSLIATVRKGEFRVVVTTSGELRAPVSSRSPSRPTPSRPRSTR